MTLDELFAQQKKQAPQKEGGLKKIAGGLDAVFGGGKVGEAIGTLAAKSGLTGLSPEERKLVSDGPNAREVAGSALRSAALFTPVGKVAGALGGGALANIGAGAVAGYGYDVASNLEAGKQGLSTLAPGAGTAIGAAVPGSIEGVRAIGNAVGTALPKLLSYTSDVPEKAFEQLLQRREPVAKAIKAGATPESALRNTQEAVRGLRTSLTQEWADSSVQIIDEFKGKRIGFGDKAMKMMEKVADDFPLETPINPKSMSVKETMELMKSVNELYSKRAVKESAQGITVRKFKEFLETEMVGKFGGKQGSVAKLYANYSSKKGVLDAANDIVKAYSTGKPIQQSTALGRLQALFNENKSAYLDAILDLEKATGKDLLSQITASKFSGKMPNRLASVSSSGGLNAPKGIMDKALDLLILPLSSPRSAAWIARNLGGAKAPMKIVTPGDRLMETEMGKRVGESVSNSIKNPSLGMSIKPIHKDDLNFFGKIAYEKRIPEKVLARAKETLRSYGMEVPKTEKQVIDFITMLYENQLGRTIKGVRK